MAALTNNKTRDFRLGDYVEIPVKADTRIYEGAMVCTVGGYAVPGADTASYVFMGVATEEADNTGGADGDIKVRVQMGCVESLAASSADATWTGQEVCVADDATVALAASTTNDIKAGKVMRFISSTRVEVLLYKE